MPKDLEPASSPAQPSALFEAWLDEARTAGVAEPRAMTLATVGPDGRPSARIVLHRRIDAGRWLFAATSRHSRKGRDLARNPAAALVFHWPEQGRQVRVTGTAVELGPEASARDYLDRSPASRAEALTGHAGDVLDDPETLDAALHDAAARLTADPGLVAEDWTLYALEPDEVELHQLDPDRRHERLRFTRTEKGWRTDRLWP